MSRRNLVAIPVIFLFLWLEAVTAITDGNVEPHGRPARIERGSVLPRALSLLAHHGAKPGKVITTHPAVKPTFRITGGEQSERNRFPWMCSLRRNDDHYCGGSLIAPNVVLTAAHCLDLSMRGIRRPVVHLGRNARVGNGDAFQPLRCSSTIVHPQWNKEGAKNDLALCFLNDTSRFQPVRLADETHSLPSDMGLTIIGWGAKREGGKNSEMLQEATVYLMDVQQCNMTYSGWVSSAAFCAGRPQGVVDTCLGDSGGPIIIQGANAAEDVQVGIISFGHTCGAPNVPGVYTDIRKYREWIYDQLKAKDIPYEPLNPKRTSLPVKSQSGAGAALQTSQTPRTPTALPNPSPWLASPPGGDPGYPEGSCSCTTNGLSGAVQVPSGCAQYRKAEGDLRFFCYVSGGTTCPSAFPLKSPGGAALLECSMESTVMDKGELESLPANHMQGPSPSTATTRPSTSNPQGAPSPMSPVGTGSAEGPPFTSHDLSPQDGVLENPLTRDQQEAPMPEGPCGCTPDGLSGQVQVPSGCAQHQKAEGDLRFFCYVSGGTTCPSAVASKPFGGAAWRECSPEPVHKVIQNGGQQTVGLGQRLMRPLRAGPLG